MRTVRIKRPSSIIFLLAGNCDNVKWITRDQWGAKAPKKALGKVEDFKYLVVHHTSTYTDGICVLTHEEGLGRRKLCKDGVKDVQNKHMDDRGYDDIGYNFLIDRFGNVYEGRGYNVEGGHTYRYNCDSYGVNFLGNFQTKNPSDEAIQAFYDLKDVSCDFWYSDSYLNSPFQKLSM